MTGDSEIAVPSVDAQQGTVVIDERVRRAAGILANGDAQGALAILDSLLDDPAAGLHARFVLSLTAWQMGRLDWSVQLMQQCHDDAPMESTIAEALASLYAQAGNLGEALFMGKMATALGGAGDLSVLVPSGFPGFNWAFLNIKDDPLLAQAKLSLAAGKFKDGLGRVRQHVALYPAAREARIYCASLLLRAGTASLAAETLRQIEGEADLPASFFSTYARSLAAIGEADAARRYHDKAAAAAPDDAEIAAARVADGIWTGTAAPKVAATAAAWAEKFCPPRKPATWSQPRGKLVIGYLVSAFADPLDAAAVAAVAHAHDRTNVTVLGYGHGALSWEENLALSGGFDKWQDISALDAATLARYFSRDGVQVMIDAGGFAAPKSLLALSRLRTAVRVGWLGNPSELGQPVYDARIVACSSSAEPNDMAWRIAGAYPVVEGARSPLADNAGGIAFGADVALAQLDAETVRVWSLVLRATPDAKLLLRMPDMGPGGNVDRLIARFGRDLAARIDLVSSEQPKNFYAGVDIVLAPCRGASARAAAEAVGCGVPVVAFGGAGRSEPYGALLRDAGLGDLMVASDERDYIGIASGLAASGEAREQVCRTLASAVASGLADAGRFAREIEKYAASALTECAPT